MRDRTGRILYVGKSKRLRTRLRSYFREPQPRKRIRQLVAEIADIEIMLVNNEPESLILENNLIKIHKPPYNRALKKDNSGYAYLKLTKEPLPRLDVFYRDRRPKAEAARAPGKAQAARTATGQRRSVTAVAAPVPGRTPDSAGAAGGGGTSDSAAFAGGEKWPVTADAASRGRTPDSAGAAGDERSDSAGAAGDGRSVPAGAAGGEQSVPAGAAVGKRSSAPARAASRGSRPDSAGAAGDERLSVSAGAVEEEVRFGPYLSARFRNAVMEFVTDHYKLRTCVTLPKRACLLYHIGKCSGVCEGHISEDEYRETVRRAADLLANRGTKLLEAMYASMEEYAERLEFEKAENMLRHIRILEQREAKQVVDREITFDQDVLYAGDGAVLVAKVQEGMLRDFELHPLDTSAGAADIDRFLLHHYRNGRPDEIIVNRVHDLRTVRSGLRRPGLPPVRITLPKRGLKHDLLQLCRENYAYRTRHRHSGEAAAAAEAACGSETLMVE